MKKIFILFSIVLLVVILLGADIRREKTQMLANDKVPCRGYTIIEFGKAINCNGDTVKLKKVRGGGQQLATNESR